jgi:hypothetical protein
MNKKKITVLLFAVITTTSVQAQFNLGMRAGFNLTNITEKFNDYKPTDVKYVYISGFQIGLVSEWTVSGTFAIQPTVLFTTYGGRKKGIDFDGKYTRYVNYLQIPINALYKMNLGRTKLFLQGGPYLSYALSGKYKWVNNFDWYDSGEQEITFGYNHDEAMMRPFDFGLGIGAGIQFNNFQVGLGYNLGLANLSTQPKAWKHSLKTDGFAATLTYLFGKRNQKEE